MRDKVQTPAVSSSAVPHRRRTSRFRSVSAWIGVFALAVVICVVATLLAFALVNGRADLRNGVGRLQDAQARLQAQSNHETDAAMYAYLKGQVDASASDFHRASVRLEPFAPVLHLLGWVPKVGGELQAAPQLAAMADATGQGLKDLLVGIQPVAVNKRAGSRVNFSVLLPKLAARGSNFRSACTSFDGATAKRRSISSGSIGSITSQLHTFDRDIAQLRVACQGLALLPSILGYPQPKRYLLVYQNPAELRATGGFIGSAGILRFNRGKIAQRFHGTGFNHENESVPSPEPVQYYNNEPYWLFRDSNWSPNFPTSAALERYFLGLDLHTSVAGTINITPDVAQAALAVVGPQYIAQYHKLVTSDNVAELADYYANWSTAPAPGVSAKSDIHGKQFINLVAQRLFARLEHLSARTWLTLVQRLATAVQQRQIQLNFLDPSVQGLVRMMHADGGVSTTTTDYLYVVDTNLSYNKINPYVHERIGYTARVRKDRWVQSTLTLRYENRTPKALSGQGIGPGAGRLGTSIDYADFIRVYVPAGSQLVSQSGWSQPWDPGSAYGKTMFCGYLLVPHNRKATVRLTYVIPPNVFKRSNGSRYVLHVQHQAGSHPDSVDINVGGAVGAARAWHVLSPVADATFNTPVQQKTLSPIPLPKQPSVVVAPGHWIEPHAYLSPARHG